MNHHKNIQQNSALYQQ